MNRAKGESRLGRPHGCAPERLDVSPQSERDVLPDVGPRVNVRCRSHDGTSAFGEMGRHRKFSCQRLELRVAEMTGPNLGHDRRGCEVHDRVVGVLEDPGLSCVDPQLPGYAESRCRRQASPILSEHGSNTAPIGSGPRPCPRTPRARPEASQGRGRRRSTARAPRRGRGSPAVGRRERL